MIGCWLCDACLAAWKADEWQERHKKVPPHAVPCDGCGAFKAYPQDAPA